MTLQALEHINLTSLADTALSLATAFILGSLIGFERMTASRASGAMRCFRLS